MAKLPKLKPFKNSSVVSELRGPHYRPERQGSVDEFLTLVPPGSKLELKLDGKTLATMENWPGMKSFQERKTR